MKYIPTKNQLVVLEQFEIGQKFWSSDIKGLTDKSLGGVLSGLYRLGRIKPLFRELRDNKSGKYDVMWERVS